MGTSNIEFNITVLWNVFLNKIVSVRARLEGQNVGVNILFLDIVVVGVLDY